MQIRMNLTAANPFNAKEDGQALHKRLACLTVLPVQAPAPRLFRQTYQKS